MEKFIEKMLENIFRFLQDLKNMDLRIHFSPRTLKESLIRNREVSCWTTKKRYKHFATNT